jgi:hypothetical protein
MSFPVVFHTENWAVHTVYLPTPRWHHLKALNLPKWIKERRPLRSLKRTDRYLNFRTQKIGIIGTQSKRQRHMTPLLRNWKCWSPTLLNKVLWKKLIIYVQLFGRNWKKWTTPNDQELQSTVYTSHHSGTAISCCSLSTRKYLTKVCQL